MKTIGFVCEGPRDSDMLEAIIRHILNEDITPLYLQPEPTLTGENGNGWKGVWSWCHKNGETLDQYMNGAIPKIDMIIIQMDGDVFRKEKEVHCVCNSDKCESSGEVFPLECEANNCPVVIPCTHHADGIDSCVEFLGDLILSNFPGEYVPLCIIPCDSTDTWIVAAYDDFDGPELIPDPWNSIISRRNDYHGIRVPGHKKTKIVYDKFIPHVCENWEIVKERCSQAAYFDHIISELS